MDFSDLVDIATWGSNNNGRNAVGNVTASNSRCDVRLITKLDYDLRAQPANALKAMSVIDGFDEVYASKALMFMDPDNFVAQDNQHMREGLKPYYEAKHIPQSGGKRYAGLLRLCRGLQDTIAGLKIPPPAPSYEYPNIPRGADGKWLLADIQQAMFQFTKKGGSIKDC